MVWYRHPETDPRPLPPIPSHSDNALPSIRFSRQAINGRTGRRDDLFHIGRPPPIGLFPSVERGWWAKWVDDPC